MIEIIKEYSAFDDGKIKRTNEFIQGLARFIEVNYTEETKEELRKVIISKGGSIHFCLYLAKEGILKKSDNWCVCNGGTWKVAK